MPDLRWLLYRLRNLWRRQAREAELDAELQFHLEASPVNLQCIFGLSILRPE